MYFYARFSVWYIFKFGKKFLLQHTIFSGIPKIRVHFFCTFSPIFWYILKFGNKFPKLHHTIFWYSKKSGVQLLEVLSCPIFRYIVKFGKKIFYFNIPFVLVFFEIRIKVFLSTLMPVFLATYTSGKKFFSSYPFFPLYPNPAYFFFVLLVPDFPVFRPEFFKNNLFFAFWAHICFLKIEKHLKSLLSNLKIWILNSIYKDIQDIFYTMDLRAFIFWICFIIYFCF